MTRKILFVCSANKDRSKTAEDYFSEKFQELEFASAGTNHKICHRLGTQPITQELLNWSEIIMVMEEKHRSFIKHSYYGVADKRIKVLSIPDRFKYFQNELIEILVNKVEPIFKEYK